MKERTELFEKSLYAIGNGVDIVYRDSKRPGPFIFEDICFGEISKLKEENSLLIGPHLIDRHFSVESGALSRPDAIKFDITLPREWVLTDLFEFKSGKKRFSLADKLRGFSWFLKELRQDEKLLKSLLQTALVNKNVAPRVIIPNNEQIKITFMSRRAREDTLYEDSKFARVTHLYVPAVNGAF